MTIGYLDGSAVAAYLSAGPVGDQCASMWKSLDIACSHDLVQIEVPSNVGRSLERFAWVWVMNSLMLVNFNEAIHAAAIDLAWLGAPTMIAIDVATADHLSVDHFITTDSVSSSWATMRGLNVSLFA